MHSSQRIALLAPADPTFEAQIDETRAAARTRTGPAAGDLGAALARLEARIALQRHAMAHDGADELNLGHLRHQAARDAARQVDRMQRRLGHTPVAVASGALVDAVDDEAGEPEHEVDGAVAGREHLECEEGKRDAQVTGPSAAEICVQIGEGEGDPLHGRESFPQDEAGHDGHEHAAGRVAEADHEALHGDVGAEEVLARLRRFGLVTGVVGQNATITSSASDGSCGKVSTRQQSLAVPA